MSLTDHQFSALRYVAAHPGADAQTRYVGTRTAATLERLGLVTVDREISHHRVRISPLSARTGTRMRPQCDESVTITAAGRATLARTNPGVTPAGHAVIALPVVQVARTGVDRYSVTRGKDVVATFHFRRTHSSKWGPQVSAWYRLGNGPQVETSHAYFNDMKRFMLDLVGAQ